MATVTTEQYRTYSPRPFTRAERESTTILFGGLHWRLERMLQAALEHGGYRTQILPMATKEDLLTGREVADIGQCCPTSFTTGNLVNFLKKKSGEIGAEAVNKQFVYLTAGSCGACRFGQYHQSYELALRNSGLEAFRMFLMAQDNLDQKAVMGDGLDLNLPITLGCLWAIFCSDLVQDLEYQVRPYEVVPGQTDAVVRESIDHLCDVFLNRPKYGPWKAVGWHLTTRYFTKAMREVHRRFAAIEVDRLRVKPKVKITGEFYLQTVEGDPNYNIHRWLEQEGAEVYPAGVAVWMDYLLRLGLQRFEDYSGIERGARLKLGIGRTVQAIYRWTFDRLRGALGDLPHDLPSQFELRRLAAPYFHSRLDGGEGDMLVGKALWAYHRKKAHMICELSPYSCMPNTMSIGAMSAVTGKYPDLLYAPLEIKGDAEVHALSRCQMILTEAKKRAQREMDEVLDRTKLTLDEVRAYVDTHPEMKRATYRIPHGDAAGTAADFVLHVARRMGAHFVKLIGLDVGSTTVKAVVVDDGRVAWKDYQRHNTRQAEKVLEFLGRMETEAGVTVGTDRVFFTGSGAGFIAPLVGGKLIQEVVAVAACVEQQHPDVRFVSEIGGEDMKTIFFTATTTGRSKQVYMQSACSGGTGTFIEKTARKLQVPGEKLAVLPYAGMSLHKVSSKCGIFAETDANTLVKTGVPVEEIIASLFEAVVYQNLATLTKGNTPLPEVLLLGGPNLFFTGLQEAWRHHLAKLWSQRKIELPAGRDAESLIIVPQEALYYACLGCVEIGKDEAPEIARYTGREKLEWWVETGQHEEKAKSGARGLVACAEDLSTFTASYERHSPEGGLHVRPEARGAWGAPGAPQYLIGCDFGSTTAKAVVLTPERELLFSCYALSKGNPIEDAQSLFRQVREAGFETVAGLALTGYGKDLLKDVLGADVGVVETVAHATASLHYVPDADVICDVGGTDVKIMILRQGTVADFRLNSQCSSGNGAFLQGVAERYNVPLQDYASRAFQAKAMPSLAMGCGVFLQSDIVNQQRKGWSAEEIMAALAAVLPVNVWIYAGQLQNLRAVGRKFVLQGGTHRNMAVVKAQVDFIRSKVPEAEVVLHPYSGEAGAIGAALCAIDRYAAGATTTFRGFDTIAALTYTSTTSAETVCKWCPINCTRTFIDVQLPGAKGRPWSKLALAPGYERVISGNSCPKGLVEDVNELRVVKGKLEETKREYPNVAEMVRKDAFRRPAAVASEA